MKKAFIGILLVVGIGTVFSGCGNRQMLDTTYTFNKAILSLPNGEIIEGPVDSWKDYEDGDQIQVKINGVTYLAHSENVVLIAEEK